ncbi:MAG: PQQ-binding-like beta-propeller repeat protein [Candidatus Bathyarchaeia archaeon]
MEKGEKLPKILTITIMTLLLGSPLTIILQNPIAANALDPSQRINPLTGQPYGDIMQYEWPQYGCDEGQTGFSPGPAPNKPNILWRTSVPGVSGQPIVFSGKVFVAAGSTLYALDAFTGSVVWTRALPRAPSGFGTNYVVKLTDEYLMVWCSGPVILRISTGEIVADLWIREYSRHPGSGQYFWGAYSRELKMAYVTAYNSTTYEGLVLGVSLENPLQPKIAWKYVVHSPSEVITCGGGKVFLGTTEATVYALDGKTGRLLWETHTRGGLVQQSAIYYNGKLYTSAVTTQLTCFDGETGKILWQYEKGGRAFSAYKGAAAYGMIFDTTVEVDPHGHVRAWDAETGELVWKQPAYFFISYTTVAVADGKVYTSICDRAPGAVFAGITPPGYTFACFDAFTGALLWRILGMSFAHPTIAYGNLYGIYGGFVYAITDAPKDWTHGLIGNIENPRVAVGQAAPEVLKVRWEFQTGGDVSSSPAVVKGRVYVGSHDKNWYCLDAYTGTKIWNYTVGAPIRSSAAVVDGRMFTGNDDGYFYCLNATTGQLIWKTPAGGALLHLIDPMEFQVRSSPIVVNSRVYVGSVDGKVYCLKVEDGTVLWTYQTEGPVLGSPVYYKGTIYITSTDRYLYALNATTGSLVWRSFPLNMNIGVPSWSLLFNIGTPTVGDGILFVGGGVTYGTALPGVDYYPHSVPAGANGGGIRFFAFNATTGESIWNQTLAGNTQPVWVPAYWNGRLYISEFCQITCMNATNPNSGPYKVADFGESPTTPRRAGYRLWGQWLGYQISSSVAYADDIRGPKVYVGCDVGSVTVLNALDGKPLSSFTTPGNVPSSPAIWDGKVYIGSVNGKVYCFDDSPRVTTSISSDFVKGMKLKLGESVKIRGRLFAIPEEFVWDSQKGTYVPVQSSLRPGIPNTVIHISIIKPDMSVVNITTTTDKHGYFEVTYTPDVAGWTCWVAWSDGEMKPAVIYNAFCTEEYWFEVIPPLTQQQAAVGPAIPTEYIIAIILATIIIIAIAIYIIKRKR